MKKYLIIITLVFALLFPFFSITKAEDAVVNNITITKPLLLGSKGGEVTTLQNWLIKNGYLLIKIPTGYYGTKTKQAILDFQKANDLKIDGKVGPQVRNFLKTYKSLKKNSLTSFSWKSLSQVQLINILSKVPGIYYEKEAGLSITKEIDLTGDGINEGIVSGIEGNSGVSYILMKDINGNIVVAKSKNKEGSISTISLLSVTKVMVQEGYEFVSNENGFYTYSLTIDESVDNSISSHFKCGENSVGAYSWNNQIKMFEWNQLLTMKYTNQVCKMSLINSYFVVDVNSGVNVLNPTFVVNGNTYSSINTYLAYMKTLPNGLYNVNVSAPGYKTMTGMKVAVPGNLINTIVALTPLVDAHNCPKNALNIKAFALCGYVVDENHNALSGVKVSSTNFNDLSAITASDGYFYKEFLIPAKDYGCDNPVTFTYSKLGYKTLNNILYGSYLSAGSGMGTQLVINQGVGTEEKIEKHGTCQY